MDKTLLFARRTARAAACVIVVFTATLGAQVPASAYRVLGQPDFQQSGLNVVQGNELNTPGGIALDPRPGESHLYVSDSGNSRVLGWRDTNSYQNGDRPTVILGQPSYWSTQPLGIGVRGFNGPAGMAVHPFTGDLYVADAGNNRVLRFPAPMSNPSRVEPDFVIGQPDFSSRGANTGGIGSNSMRAPRSVAFDGQGNLWVADTGNHRVLRFPAPLLDVSRTPEADLVLGQSDFRTAEVNRGGTVSASGFNSPAGIFVDRQDSVYVADFNNLRVLRFAAPLVTAMPATGVLGQPDLSSRVVPSQPSSLTMGGPVGVSVDGSQRVYVAIPPENRVLVFESGNPAAVAVLGQTDFTSTTANAGASPLAAAGTLSAVADVKADRDGNVYVADQRNHRAMMFPAGVRTASKLWGQTEFTANGANQIKPVSINAAFKMAIDYSQQPYTLYVSDTNNHRILAWRNAVAMRSGDPADFVIGQPDLRTAVPNIDSPSGVTPSRTSVAAPKGIAVDAEGNLWVADSGNHRVLRFPIPARQQGRVAADVVLGQTSFTTAVSAVVNASSLREPAAVAISGDGNVFVADAGNNRVLEFPSGSQTAVRVYGQPSFNSGTRPATVSPQTLAAPQGLFVDAGQNLYVADTASNRVVIFPDTRNAPPSGAASVFTIGGAAAALRTPADVSVGPDGEIYVSDSGNNRILIFPSLLFLPLSGAVPLSVIGQSGLSATEPNGGSGSTSAQGLFGPLGIFLDRRGTLYVGDSGNNRVLQFLKAVSVVNAAHFQAGSPVARGGIVALFGAGLADSTETAPSATWPTSLAARAVLVNDEFRGPLAMVSPGQINFQLPSTAPTGSARVAVTVAETGELVAGGTIAIAASAPGLFSASQDGRGQALAVNQDGRRNTIDNPAQRGSVITLYGTGQGQVSPPVPDGIPAPPEPLSSTVAIPTSDSRACVTNQPSLCVAVGTGFGEIQFSGLAPGFVGLWQINVRVPESIPQGTAVPVRVLINAAASNTLTIAVR